MWSNSYGNSYLFFMLGGIIGSIWLGFVCKWFVIRNTFLQLLGQNTIIILAVHEPIKRIILKIVEMGTHEELLKLDGVYAKMWREYQKSVTWNLGKEVAAHA